MKRVFLLTLLLFTANVVFSQMLLTGTITDENGNPLPGASVVIENTFAGTLSDDEGKFQFPSLPKKEFVLKVSFLGYESQRKKIDLNSTNTLDFQLQQSDIMAEEVIVRATRVSERTPIAHSNLDKELLKKQNSGQDIPYLLNLTPSFVSTSEAGTGIGYTNLRIRGSDASRINVTVNGIPLNDAESHSVYWVNMPDFAESVNNVQIQRGVGTSTNGAGAFGASINFQTYTINKKAYCEMKSAFGSFNTYKNSINVGTGLINGKFSFDARYSKIKSDGYVDYAFVDHEAFFVSGTYYTKKSLVKINVFSGDQRTGITWWGNEQEKLKTDRTYNPAGQYTDFYGNQKYYKNQTDNYKQTHYQLIFSKELHKNISLNAALHYTKGNGFYEQYKQDELFSDYGLAPIRLGDTLLVIGGRSMTFPDSTISQTDIIRRKMMANDFYGFTYALNYNYGKLDASFGGAWNRYDGDHFGRILWSEYTSNNEKDYQWYTNKGEKTDFNVFAKINFAVSNKMTLFGDMQYRMIKYEMSGLNDELKDLTQEHDFNFFNPKFGFFYKMNDKQEVYASLAVANREPTRTNFKKAAGDKEATPLPERLYDYELGYNFRTTNLALGINLYYMDYKDQLVPTGKKSSVGYDIMTNVSESYRAGIELTAGAKWNNFHWDFNTTLSKNKIKNFVEWASYYDENWVKTDKATELGETDLAYSPSVVLANRLSYQAARGLNFYLITKYVGEQYFDNTSNKERKLDAYTFTNVKIDYSIETKFIKNINFYFQLNNLFDKEYENNAYGGNWYENGSEKTWAYYFPQAGMNYLAGVSLKF